jgi:chromosome segregation ATPase
MSTKRSNHAGDGGDGAQDITVLKKRYEGLREQKTIAETNLKAAERELQKLKKEAKETYETDDIAELKKKLDDMKEQNETKRAAYQKSLDKIESDLAEVEAKYEASKAEEAERRTSLTQLCQPQQAHGTVPCVSKATENSASATTPTS